MKLHNHNLRLSAIAMAVLGALMSLSAQADEAEIQALKMPANTVELGVITPSKSSAKFGEYTGLNTSSSRLTGNLNLRGGTAYSDNDKGGTERWSLQATDLGLMSGSAQASMAEQGRWSFSLGFDSLRHNLDGSYQTPYIGAMGGNVYTLPSNFGLAATAGAGANVLTANQLAAFHNLDISSTRKNTSLSASMVLDSRTSLNFDYNHLAQSGAKLMGFGIAGVGGATGEAVAILPMPTSYKTDTVNLSLHWKGDQSYLTTSYFGSFFTDDFDRVNFQSFAGTTAYTGALQSMTTAPSNSFNQLGLHGGYTLAPKPKWVANFSYGRNTQNSAFVTPETGLMRTAAQATSLNSEVINTHADVKITDQSYQNLTLSGAFKFDERDNQTTSYLYNFNAISGAHTALYANNPLSHKKALLEFAGDYKFKPGHGVRVALLREDIDRWCNSFAYPVGANCVTAKSSKDDRVEATYRMKANDVVDLRVGYGYSDRQTTTDPYAIGAFIGTNGAVPGPVPSPNLTPKGQNAGDYYGFYPFFEATRQQQSVKGQVNWEATDQLALGLSAKYTEDKYGSSTYGVQNGSTWSFNADSSYTYQENGSVYAYVTKQHRERELTSAQRSTVTASAASATAIGIPAVATWTNFLKDNDTTVGVGIKQSGLMGGKLELSGDATYSLGAGIYSTMLNYATTTTGGLTCASAPISSCGQLPDIKSTMGQIKLTGVYQVDKVTKISLRYAYQKLASADFYYNGYQYGFSPATLMPTNQVAPSYAANVIALSWVHSF